MARSWSSVSVIGKARGKRVPQPRWRLQHRRFAQRAFGRDADQLVRHLADALFQLGLFGLPRAAAQAIQQALFMAIARQQFDVLDRQVQLGLLGIFQQQAFMRSTGGRDHLHAHDSARCRDPRARPDHRGSGLAFRSGNSRRAACVWARGSGDRPTRPVPKSPAMSGASKPCSSAQTARCRPRLPIRVAFVIGTTSARPSSSISPVRRSRAPSE